MKNKFIIYAIIIFLIGLSVFSIVLSYKVIMNFSSSDIYTLTKFKDDVELSLIVMIANIIGDISLFAYLNKNGILQKMFNIEN
ncbi:hypothetical protein SAMN04489796_101393 [Winogradskyella thalassocola]|uniref:Uncharacterized protein n=1 Tax=Winogradskyella thalassocola TaxID=262004 RepID=A0A1G7WJR9_9FLAO|nr:hypothetical protein SAMN04489796_101393 [Winogradskyella thalassocola]